MLINQIRFMKIKSQQEAIDEEIEASYSATDWRQDPKGYYLVRLNRELKRIEVAFVHNDHKIKKIIFGKNATEIYYTLIKKGLIEYMEHAAYLGKELYKAELALKYNLEYVQDAELIIK